MKTTILNGNNALQKLILQANIRFVDLKDRVKFTHMSEAQLNPYSRDSYALEKNYQRRVSDARKQEIKKYIHETIITASQRNEEPVLFPTAMLLACTLDYLDAQYSDGEYLHLPPDVEFYIVDGQHRLASMIDLYDDLKKSIPYDDEIRVVRYLDQFKFNCTILLNFDMWEQARVFADVNFNQKKVDRSLYYSIYGMDFDEEAPLHTNAMYAAHNLVVALNNRDNSVMKDKIRMLGKGKGLVSQAFVADSLLRHISSSRGIWHLIFKKVCGRDDLTRRFSFMTDETMSFFKIVKETFPEQWPIDDEHRSILLKTTGIGALMRLMGYIHKKHDFDGVEVERFGESFKSISIKDYENLIRDEFVPLKEFGETFFGLNGRYAGTGGAGLEAKLYKTLITWIDREEGQTLIDHRQLQVNNLMIGVKIYQDRDGIYSFVLSHYFKNSYQMDYYRPGSGSLAFSLSEIENKLRAYIAQVDPDAVYQRNDNF